MYIFYVFIFWITEYPPTGPGDYNDDKIFRIGQPVRVTTGAVKRK